MARRLDVVARWLGAAARRTARRGGSSVLFLRGVAAWWAGGRRGRTAARRGRRAGGRSRRTEDFLFFAKFWTGLICRKFRGLFHKKIYGPLVDFCKVEGLFCKIYMRSDGLDLFSGRSDGSRFFYNVAQ